VRPTVAPQWRPAAAAAALLFGVIAVRSTLLPGSVHFAFHCAVVVALVGLAKWAELTLDEIGLGRSTLRRGAAVGAVVLVAVGLLVGAATWLAEVDDDRLDISQSTMWLRALVVIPIGTVLMEELAFRGVLLASCRRATTTRNAVLLSSFAFGLWHIVGAWNGADGSFLQRMPEVLGTVAATTAAGLGFSWLRLRTDSLLPPMAAHVATNSVAFAVSWFAAHR